MRRTVFALAPTAAERVAWDAISFFDPARGGPIKGSICQLVYRDDVLRLDFPLGALMDDPTGLLVATPGRKAKRYVELGASRPKLTQIRALIEASLEAPAKPKRLPG